jgi:hypothetical protein
MVFVIEGDGDVFEIEICCIAEGHQLHEGRKNDEKPQARIPKGLQHLFPKKDLQSQKKQAHQAILMLNFLRARLKMTTA